MKKITTALLLLQSIISFSQIVEIPDANFKNALLNYNPVIDTNGDGEIQVNEALVVEDIDVSSMGITDLTGIEAFVNLDDLRARFNTIEEIDVSGLNALRTLWLSNNQLTEIDITSKLKYLPYFLIRIPLKRLTCLTILL